MSRYVRIKVTPGRPKSEWGESLSDGTLKVKVGAKAEHGKANAELIRFLAEEWKLKKDQIVIVSGKNDTVKLIRIED